MKNILSQILLSILLCTYSQAILAISSQAIILVKDTQINTETETIRTKFREKLKFLIAQSHRLSCKNNRRYKLTSHGKEYYYNLRGSTGLVIQKEMTESECHDAIRELATNGVACVKNRLNAGQYLVFPNYNLISTQGIIESYLDESTCLEASKRAL